jgi:hypothetical protein
VEFVQLVFRAGELRKAKRTRKTLKNTRERFNLQRLVEKYWYDAVTPI